MKLKRIIGAVTAVVALTAAGILYSAHPVKSSDHQDTYNLANAIGHNPSADITDVFVFPAPDNANNVVLAMDVYPLIPTGMGPSKFFDPTIMWQFKIAHGATSPEDQVIQIGASGTGATQRITLYGPGAPNPGETTVDTFLPQPTGTITYGNTGNFQNNQIQFFAGPRSDPFVFDLLAFFTFLGDRNYAVHTAQDDPATAPGNTFFNGDTVPPTNTLAPPYDQTANPKTPSFNGFAGGTNSGAANGSYACSTNPASNSLGTFNVLTFVVELPKTMLEPGSASHTIHVWATSSSSTTTS